MSGVGITGLIEPLNGGSFPVFEDINGLGGFRAVADATARLAIPANFKKIGMQVAEQSTGLVYTWDGTAWQQAAGQNPFKATVNVDPAFTGLSTGSNSNPFKTIAAAFAYFASLALAGGVIRIPPSVTVTENVVFPATGGQWEIKSDVGFAGSSLGSRITGTITCDVTSGLLVVKLTNLIVTGNTTGNAANGTTGLFQSTCVRQNGSITLTQAGTGNWISIFRGIGPAYASKPSGSNTLAVSVAGQITADNWVFEGGCTEALAAVVTPYPGSTWRSCQLGSTNSTAVTMNLNGASNAFFYDCISSGPVTFASTTANYTILMDGATLAALGNPVSGIILTGTGMVLKTINANLSDRQTLTNNVGSSNFGARNADGLYEVVFDQTLLVAGTTGLLQLNVIYTDMTGTLITAPVGGTLNITAAVGSKNQGSLSFRHNGAAAPIAFSYTGIVTPGAMSVAASVALMLRT